jgi:hypothetical protein
MLATASRSHVVDGSNDTRVNVKRPRRSDRRMADAMVVSMFTSPADVLRVAGTSGDIFMALSTSFDRRDCISRARQRRVCACVRLEETTRKSARSSHLAMHARTARTLRGCEPEGHERTCVILMPLRQGDGGVACWARRYDVAPSEHTGTIAPRILPSFPAPLFWTRPAAYRGLGRKLP